MAKSTIQSSDVSLAVPVRDVAGVDVVIADTVISLTTAVPMNAETTEVHVHFTGVGDVRVRCDGNDPAGGSSGALWLQGGLLKLNRATADKVKLIRDGATSGAIYVEQFSR